MAREVVFLGWAVARLAGLFDQRRDLGVVRYKHSQVAEIARVRSVYVNLGETGSRERREGGSTGKSIKLEGEEDGQRDKAAVIGGSVGCEN